jgi:hypothetical protein
MTESLADFCKRYRVAIGEEPQLLPYSRESWLVTDTAGMRWVAKAKEPEETIPERLKSFAVLYPPFLYPRPASQPYDPYLLYSYIEGTVLADGPFEEGETIDQVREIIGRVQALMRSLNLAPHYQQTLRSREPGQEDLMESRFSLGWLQAMNDQQKRGRRREIAESFHWTEARLQEWCGAVQSRGVWAKAPLAAYREQIQKNFSMHVPVVGSNLCHTAIQPEHLLLCPGGQMGVLGWHIEPRPRFYMGYTYLAWGLLHSRRGDSKEYYRTLLAKNSSASFYEEHHRVFALCLIEQVARCCREQASGGFQPSEQRLQEAEHLFKDCVENLAEKEKKAADFMQS